MDYSEAISFDELYKGLQKAARGVSWKDSVAAQLQDGLRKTYHLRNSLLDGTYELSRYHRFTIHEPKTREIVATGIKDRQYQRSICDNILTPQITRHFIYDNCACQKGKGVDFALNRMDTHLHRYFRKHGAEGWVLRCDIYHYFPETLHDVAKAAVRKRVTDDEAYQTAADIIDSFGGDRGIGLGSQVSQLVQLAVLDDLDHYIKEKLRIKHYIRYMDDFVLIHQDRAVLEECLKVIREHVRGLGLELNSKTQIHQLRQGIRFLQWRFLLTESGKVIRRMSRRSITRERRKLKKLALKVKTGKCPAYKVYESFQSWRAHARRGNTYGVERNMTMLYQNLMNEVSENERDREHGTGAGQGPSAAACYPGQAGERDRPSGVRRYDGRRRSGRR